MFNRFASLTALVLASSFATLAVSQSAQALSFSRGWRAPTLRTLSPMALSAQRLGVLRAAPGIRIGAEQNAVGGFSAQRGHDLGVQLTHGIIAQKLDPRDFLRTSPSQRVTPIVPTTWFPTMRTLDPSKLLPVVAPSLIRLPNAPLATGGF